MLSPSARTRRTSRTVRYLVLITVLVISTAIGLLHQLKNPAFFPVGVDALCPFGGVETLWALIADTALIRRIALSSVLLLVATLVVSLFAGRAFCGQICPLGTLQELFGRLGRKLKITLPGLPGSVDTVARMLKYVVLAVFTALSWMTATLVIRPYDPWAAYHHITSPELFTEFGIGFAVLVLSLGGSLVYERFFCRYACPMGALLGLLSRFSWFKVRRTEQTCTDCNLCNTACPVGLDVSNADAVTSPECIMCGECVTSCPSSAALQITDRGGRTISPLALTLITAAVFFGIVGISTAAGSFEWTKSTLGGSGQGHGMETGSDHGQSQGQGEGQGQSESSASLTDGSTVDVEAIKGYMTPRYVIDETGVGAQETMDAFGLSNSDLDVALKDLKDAKGFTMYDFRVFVAIEIGAPIPEPEEGH